MGPYADELLARWLGLTLPFHVSSWAIFVVAGTGVGAALGGRHILYLRRAGVLPPLRRPLPWRARVAAAAGPDLRGETTELVWWLVLAGFFAGLLGAKLFHVLEHTDELLRRPLAVLSPRGGMTFYGALLFGSGTVILMLRRWGLPLWTVGDAAAPAIFTGYGLGRIGCHVAGDGCWGLPARHSVEWLPHCIQSCGYRWSFTPPDGPVYPTALYDALAMAVAAVAFVALQRRGLPPGLLWWCSLVVLGAERLATEALRTNVRLHLLGVSLTQAQLISVAFLLVGAIGALATWRSSAQPGAAPTVSFQQHS